MPRKPRFFLPDVPTHVVQRGNNRDPIFFDESDYHTYLEWLEAGAIRYQCNIYAYVLMTNHVHLLVTPQQPHGISFMMQRLGQRYVRAINRAYRRTGTLWDGRYKAGLVESGRYLLACMRYIELNPVRASMVSHPAEYAWSSYRHNGQGCQDRLITPHPLYLQLAKELQNRCKTYRKLFSTCIEPAVLEKIRGTLNQELVLGSSGFRKQVEHMLGRQAESKPKGRPSGCKGFDGTSGNNVL